MTGMTGSLQNSLKDKNNTRLFLSLSPTLEYLNNQKNLIFLLF